MLKLIVLACFLVFVSGFAPFSQENTCKPRRFAIKTHHNTYVRAEQGQGATVNTQNFIGSWEKFHLIYLGEGKYGIRTVHRSWLRGEPKGNNAFGKVDTTHVLREWEHWRIVRAWGNNVNLWHIISHHGTYLRAEPNQFGAVNLTPNSANWEEFKLVAVAD